MLPLMLPWQFDDFIWQFNPDPYGNMSIFRSWEFMNSLFFLFIKCLNEQIFAVRFCEHKLNAPDHLLHKYHVTLHVYEKNA